MQKKKSHFWPIFLISCVVFFCVVTRCTNSNKSHNSTTTQVAVTNSAEETVEFQEDTLSETTTEDFLTSIKSDMTDTLADSVYDILTSQIGFKKLVYKGFEAPSNYLVDADGVSLYITALPASDEDSEYIRIFQPHGDTFYEDGEVIMTAEEHMIEYEHVQNCTSYYIIAQGIVEDSLNTSSKTKFPSSLSSEIGYGWKDEYVVVQSYVDIKESSGAYSRYNWTVEFIPIDVNMFTYELVYLNIGGQSIGEYVPIE